MIIIELDKKFVAMQQQQKKRNFNEHIQSMEISIFESEHSY